MYVFPDHRDPVRVQPPRSPRLLLPDLLLGSAPALVLALTLAQFFAARDELAWAGIMLLANGLLALFGFWRSLRRGYPMLLVAFFFDIVFFAVAPAQQIALRYDAILDNEELLFSVLLQCLVFTGCALVALHYRARPVARPARDGTPVPFMARSVIGNTMADPLPLFATVAALSGLLLVLYWPALFTSRQGFSEYLAEAYGKSVILALTSFCNPLVLVGALVGLLGAHARGARGWQLAFLLLLAVAVLVNNPIVGPRFRLSAVVGFAVLALWGWNNTRLLAAVLLAGIGISPLLNSFRYDVATSDVRSLDMFFVHMDFEAVTLMAHTVYYVGQVGISYGNNLLGAVLFFVPRAIWQDKADYISSYMFEYLKFYRGFETDNLSSPPPAEGYFAFGWPGVVAVTLAVLLALAWIERRAEAGEDGSPWRLIACILAMLTMILLRGPFLVGYFEMWAHALAVVAVALLAGAGQRDPNIRPSSLRRLPAGPGFAAH